ncbi:hypothetical protein Celal_4058 [Cellulophaga algicola DSM 14237]|uniref:Uncharacterized protein n=1 Tax=Cellulophaga algicola (strain DSM 14237 / IC166 / ACAM 630) TaxID=688270 RepID=E6XDW3_CELAD|nr:hypothetical protein [Cellulophaga algicola]ADV51301.1 hypothetical protein Celal_4058 [Cellulophaga algicola DSM 14237]
MEHLIGYFFITIGIMCMLGVVLLSKERIGWLIIRASICMAVPILSLWLSLLFLHLNFAEYLLLEVPYSLLFYAILTILTFIVNGFDMKNLRSFIVFLIGFMMLYFGLYFEFIIGTMRIGF